MFLKVFINILYLWKSKFNVSDNCFESLLKIVQYFLMMIQASVNGLEYIIDFFPNTLYKAKQHVGLDKDGFIKFVCCEKCNKLYTYSEVTYIDRHNNKHSNLCNHIQFPNHTQNRMRQPCGTLLMKKVTTLNGKESFFYPFKVYTYHH